MIQTRNITESLIEISSDAGYIHKIDSESYFKKGIIKVSDVSEYEEVLEIPKYTR